MSKLLKIEGPHYHDLDYIKQSIPSPQTCQKCRLPVSRDYYKCRRYGFNCEYYLHKECTELKDLTQTHHPLHPQHPLAILSFPYVESFVCSFCRKQRQSRRFYQCIDEQCDFYLDDACVRDFINRPELLKKYEIQHFLHDHKNHQLSPYILFIDDSKIVYDDEDEFEDVDRMEFDDRCEIYDYYKCHGCRDVITPSQEVYKCTGCPFYLHTKCSQVPKEVQHYSHPNHHLVLGDRDNPAHEVRCIACLKWIEYGFYLHCSQCPTFNLDLQCYFKVQIWPTMKHEIHEHPLEFFGHIHGDNDMRCDACNTPCSNSLYRCFTCNFNVHSHCLALPVTVDSDDHVHPLTLTPSFKEYDHPTADYCDICEKRKDPDHGLYLCKECPFMSHFECALSLTTAEEEATAHAPWRQKIEDDNRKSDENQEDMTLTNENVSLDIFDQLSVEIEELGEVIKQLIITKKGEHLTEKIQELDKRHKNTEDMLRRLKQSVIGTKFN